MTIPKNASSPSDPINLGWKSLRARLLGIILIPSLPTLIIAITLSSFTAERLLKNDAFNRLEERANDLKQDLHNWEEDQHIRLRALSLAPEIPSLDPIQTKKALSRFLSIYSNTTYLGIIGNDGQILSEVKGSLATPLDANSRQDPSLVQSILLLKNQDVLARTIHTTHSGSDRQAERCFATPLDPTARGGARTVIFMCVQLHEVFELVKNHRWDKSGSAILLEHGHFIAASGEALSLVNNSFSTYPPLASVDGKNSNELVFKDSYQREWISFTLSFPDAWTAVVQQETKEVLLKAFLFRNFAFAILAIAVLIMVRLAWVLSAKVRDPILQLLEGAQEIASGNLNARVDSVRTDEIGLLSSAFNQMADQLQGLIDVQIKLATTHSELEKGREIQSQFLPPKLPQLLQWEFAAAFHPAREVAGDFYDVIPLEHGRYAFVIGDVTDKGVPAAMFMALFITLIRTFSQGNYSQSDIFDVLIDDRFKPNAQQNVRHRSLKTLTNLVTKIVFLTNNYIVKNHGQSGMFATLFIGILDPATKTILYVNGGHLPPVIIGSDGQIKASLSPTGLAVGVLPDVDFEVGRIQLDPGDILFSFTDGATDARNVAEELFTEKRLLELVVHPCTSATILLDSIQSKLNQYMEGADQFDDITLLALRFIPGVDNPMTSYLIN